MEADLDVLTENAPNLLDEIGEIDRGSGVVDALEQPADEPTEAEPEPVVEEAVESPDTEAGEAGDEAVESPLDEPDAEEEPEETPEPEQSDDETAPDENVESGEFDALVARLIEAEATAETAEEVLNQKVTAPGINPDDVQFDLSDEEFEQLVTDKAAAIGILKRTAATMVNHVLQNLGPMIFGQVADHITNYELVRQFTEEYPLFKNSPKALSAAIAKQRRATPEADGPAVLRAVRKTVEEKYKEFQKIRQSAGAGGAQRKVDIRPKGGRFARGTNARGKVGPQQTPDARSLAERELQRAMAETKNTLLDEIGEV